MTNIQPVRLKALLQQNHWQTHRTFCKEYDKAAASIDPALKGTWPSRAQLHRWISGELRSLPYPDHCRVLEKMFPGWSAAQLFERGDHAASAPISDRDHDADGHAAPPNNGSGHRSEPAGRTPLDGMADVDAVFTSRSEFIAALPPSVLFDGATTIDIAGLSLNLLCQQYPDHRLAGLIEQGATVRCLFLDPDGDSIKRREEEEGHTTGHLSTLTKLNIGVLTRLRERLTPESNERLHVATYDETIRFNIIIVDNETGVIQPYMPYARGIDSPTFVLERKANPAGLLDTFQQVFASLWDRRTPL